MEERWHVAHAGQKEGPISTSEVVRRVRSGALRPDDLCWKKGMGNWAHIRDIPEFAVAPASPTPPQRTPALTPQQTPPRRPAAGAKFGFDTLLGAIDMAFDPRKLLFVFCILLIAAVGAAVLAGLCVLIMKAQMMLGMGLLIILLGVWGSACAGILIGGLARLVDYELVHGARARLGEAWGFVLRHLPGLAFSLLVLFFLNLLTGAIVNGIIYGVGQIPAIGPSLAGILTIPLFLLNLLAILVFINLTMVPAIMAVEDCDLFAALKRLLATLSKRAGRILSYEMAVSIVLWPLVVFVLMLLSSATAVTCVSTSGDSMRSLASSFSPTRSSEDGGDLLGGGDIFRGSEPKPRSQASDTGKDIGGLISMVSFGVIFAALLCFVISFLIASLTIVYRAARL